LKPKFLAEPINLSGAHAHNLRGDFTTALSAQGRHSRFRPCHRIWPGSTPSLALLCVPAVLKRERSQLDSAYCVRRTPSRSSTTIGRQRACQAERASASTFCCSGVSGGAARMTPPPPMLKSVDRLGAEEGPPTPAAALADAAAAAAFAVFEASAACPWSIDHESCCESCCADAVEMPAAKMSKPPRMLRIFTEPLRERRSARAALLVAIERMLRWPKAGELPHSQRNASNSNHGPVVCGAPVWMR
jgi:hypothetical protein